MHVQLPGWGVAFRGSCSVNHVLVHVVHHSSLASVSYPVDQSLVEPRLPGVHPGIQVLAMDQQLRKRAVYAGLVRIIKPVWMKPCQ